MATWNGPHWKVRPYMTGKARNSGRRHQLLIHTLVSTGNRFDPLLAASLAPATRTLYERRAGTRVRWPSCPRSAGCPSA